MKNKSWKKILAGCMLSLAGYEAAIAAEQPVPITPPGGTDVSQAILPDPGLYGVLISVPYVASNTFYDANGNKLPKEFNISIKNSVEAALFAYVYPFEVFGGKIASGIAIPVDAPSIEIGGKPQYTSIGLADVYTNLFYWTKNLGLAGATPGPMPLPYGLNIGAGLSMKAPTGSFSPDKPVSLGSNTWLWIPNFAVTYVTGPNLSIGNSTEVSAQVFYGTQTENPITRYQTGDVFDIDWAVTERFGLFRIGIAGTYQAQVTNDVLPVPYFGPPVTNGNKYSTVAIGPIAEYIMPEKGLVFKVKEFETLEATNSANTRAISFVVGMKF